MSLNEEKSHTNGREQPYKNGPQFQHAPLDIAIIGGGITGLALGMALYYHAPHLPFVIYEAASSFGEIGAGVGISPNASRAIKLINPRMHEAFERRRTPNHTAEKKNVWMDMLCGEDGPPGSEVVSGKHIAEVEMGQPRGGIHRAHWVDELVKLLPEGRGRFGKRLKSLEEIEEGVRLEFADGTVATHSAVIACDGIKSKTRQIILGKDDPASQPVFSGKYCYRGLIPVETIAPEIGDLEARNAVNYWGYHRHVLAFPIEQGKTMNVVAFCSKDKWDSDAWVVPASKADMVKDFSGMCEHVQKIIAHVQKPDIWALFDHQPAATYHRRRICLMGDAAHASTPHQGAGASLGIEDAYVMGMLLKEVNAPSDFDAAFEAFDHVRRPRTQRLVATSREAGQLYNFELEGIGDDIVKAAEKLRTRMAWIWDHRVEDDVDAALTRYRDRRPSET